MFVQFHNSIWKYVEFVIFANIIAEMYVTGSAKLNKSDVPLQFYAACSFAYVTAFISSNAALIYINYPTQVLAKSCKMIPVVLMGFIFARKSYSVQQLVAV